MVERLEGENFESTESNPDRIDLVFRTEPIPPTLRTGADIVDVVERVFRLSGLDLPPSFSDSTVKQAILETTEALAETARELGCLHRRLSQHRPTDQD